MRVGLIGFGAIGRRVAELIGAGSIKNAEICAVLVRDPTRHEGVSRPLVGSLEELFAASPDVVVEVAGHEALASYGEQVLRRGLTLVTTSAGVLADDAFRSRLIQVAVESGGRLVLPSGAIAGLDGIESAISTGLERVRHVVRKPPNALFDDPERVREVMAAGVPVTLFEGPAAEAVRLFPQNVNVVAMVSLAGLGFDRTTALVIADPAVTHNTHEVTAEGVFGRVSVKVENVPSPENPKTGLIVAGSVVRALRRLSDAVNVGG
jgi:aspartate dehydrogenase